MHIYKKEMDGKIVFFNGITVSKDVCTVLYISHCTCRFSAIVLEYEVANDDQNHEDLPFCCSSLHFCSIAANFDSFLAWIAAFSSSGSN